MHCGLIRHLCGWKMRGISDRTKLAFVARGRNFSRALNPACDYQSAENLSAKTKNRHRISFLLIIQSKYSVNAQ